MAQKSSLLMERNDYILKSIENFRTNKEPALTIFKQRNGYNFLPAHSTPPSKVFKIKNPFDKGLIDGLKMSFCSSTLFASRQKSNAENEEFEWTIDEIAEVRPANIEINMSQFDTSFNPLEEERAQQAIKDYFGNNLILSSPNDKEKFSLSTDATKKCLFKNSATQTDMTIPLKLDPEVEHVLKKFCTYYQEQEANCNAISKAKDESMLKNLFKDEHILGMSNEVLSMDYNTLTPVSKSPAISMLMCSRQKFNHGTPASYNIPSPSSVSPISKKTTFSIISPIQTSDNKRLEKTSNLKQKKIITNHLYHAVNKYSFCQSTPERNRLNKENSMQPNCEETEVEKSSPPTQCYDDFQCNFRSHRQSDSNTQFSQDMSIDQTRSDFVIDSPLVVNKSSSVFRSINKNFANLDNDKFDNGLTPLSPMQISQMETPLKKRSASAKNLSRSFDIPEAKENMDSGFTETTSTFDSGCDSTRFSQHISQTNISKHCYNCNNVSKINILNYKKITDLKCNYCLRQFEIF